MSESKGLNGFTYGEHIIFTRDQKTADKIAKEKGWL